jgi:hypothetical protein
MALLPALAYMYFGTLWPHLHNELKIAIEQEI